jgi:hypothetical protein
MDLALDHNHIHHPRATPKADGWIVFDGREYASQSEMPVDVRIMYERMLAGGDAEAPPSAARRHTGPSRALHAGLSSLQADLHAALAPQRSNGNSVLYGAFAITVIVYAAWLLV